MPFPFSDQSLSWKMPGPPPPPPPPGPPPPPMGGPPKAIGGGGGNRNDLLKDIRGAGGGGMRLKKVVTNDRSAPVTGAPKKSSPTGQLFEFNMKKWIVFSKNYRWAWPPPTLQWWMPNSVSKGFGTAMRTGLSRQFLWYTITSVGSRMDFLYFG